MKVNFFRALGMYDDPILYHHAFMIGYNPDGMDIDDVTEGFILALIFQI